jgi:predicted DNA-binding protein with PD1-like motif
LGSDLFGAGDEVESLRFKNLLLPELDFALIFESMEYQKDRDIYFIRIDKDEDLFKSLEYFARTEKLKSGHLSGIGALKECELGFYHLHSKTYDRKMFHDEVELLSLEGNLSRLNDDPFLHIHTVLGGDDFRCFGGHLFSAKVAVTCEVNFRPLDLLIERRPNAAIGLNLLHFCGHHPAQLK